MFLDYLEIDNFRYFVLFQSAILVKEDIKKRNVDEYVVINRIPQVGQFTRIFYYEGKILLVPLHSQNFALYDEYTNEIRAIEIPEKEISRQSYGYFSAAIQRGRYVYAFGINYPGIVRVDIEKEQAQCICELKQIGIKDKGFTGEMVEYNGKVCIPFENDVKIALFDLENERLDILNPRIEGEGIIKTVCDNGDSLILVMSGGAAFDYTHYNSTINRMPNLEFLLMNKPIICHGVGNNGEIFLFPEQGNDVLAYSYKNQEGTWYSCPIEKKDSLCFYYVNCKNNNLTFYNEYTNRLFAFDKKRNCFEKSNIQLSDDEYMRLILQESDTLIESDNTSLPMFINGVCGYSQLNNLA